MNMRISLRVEEPRKPVRYMGSDPIYPMGHRIALVTKFTNKSAGDMNIEDPKTSQKVLLRVLAEGEVEEDVHEINPGSIDITGERTAPISDTILLRPQESTIVPIELPKYCVEGCFLPGKYQLYIEFLEVKSPRLEYGVEFCPESVPTLLEFTLDETADRWIREESLRWLQKLPEKLDIELPTDQETESDRTDREARNRENARRFLQRWPGLKETEAVKNFFEDMRLK